MFYGRQVLTCDITTLAVIMIDMQPTYVTRLDPQDKHTLVHSQLEVLNHCKERDIPLIVVEMGRMDEQTIDVLQERIRKVPRVQTIQKHANNAFLETDMHERLTLLGTKSLVLMGINASCCVFDTAFAAVQHGYKIATAENLIADSRYLRYYAKNRSWYKKNGTYFPGNVIFP